MFQNGKFFIMVMLAMAVECRIRFLITKKMQKYDVCKYQYVLKSFEDEDEKNDGQ